MLYDSYHVKISKIVVVLRKIFKHIVLISIVSALVISMIVAFMATKGLIIDDSSVVSGFEMTYGEYLPLKAKAIFAKVSYEYSSDGVEWSAEMPRTTGDFRVRACANNIFGQKRYGEVYSFTVKPREIDVSVVEKEITYGNLPTVEAELAFEDSIFCGKVSYSDRVAKTTDVKPVLDSIKITNSDGDDVTSLYKLNAVAKSINILPRKIEVTVSDKEMIYNDTRFSFDGYELSNGKLADGDVLQATFDKYLIDVGEVVNTPVLRIVTTDGLDISVHYEIATRIGILKVNKRPLVVKALGAEKEYDDTELVNKSFEIAGEYNLVEGHVANCTSHTSIINAEEKENIIAIEIKNAGGEDKTPNYSLFYENGTLKITPRKINVTTPSKEGVYNAQPLSTEDTPISSCIDRLVEGHDANVEWPSITDAGSIENAASITRIFKNIEDEFGLDTIDVTKNYEIIYANKGTLTVKKCPITITYQSCLLDNDYDDVYYDGSERTFEDAKIEGDPPQNDIFEFEYPKFSQAGKYENANKAQKITVTSWRDDGTAKMFDALDNYEITEIAGTIEIGKRVYKIKLLDYSKEYDGTIFTPDSTQFKYFDETPSLADHVLSFTVKSTNSADADEYPLVLESFKVMFGETDATSNFEVSVFNEEGENYISITPRNITITATSAEKVVNDAIKGVERPWSELEYSKYTVENLLVGHTIDKIEFNTPTDATTEEQRKEFVSVYNNSISTKDNSVVIKDSDGKDVTDNYNVICQSGNLKVRKIRINVITDSVSKVYDGTPLTCKTHLGFECNCRIEALDPILTNDSFTLVHDIESTITNVDESGKNNEATFDYDSRYYNVEEKFGKLTITARDIHVTPQGATKQYDGTPLECPGYNVQTPTGADDGLVSGHKHTLKFNTITNIGKIPVAIDENETHHIVDGKGNDVTKNYNIIIEGNAELEVTGRVLTITSASASKKYDGTPLTNSNWSYDGLLPNESVSGVNITGTQTEEGSSPNYIAGTVTVWDADNNDVTKNYEIKYVEGTLTVEKDVVAQVYSYKSGSLYLKTKAYGNHNGYGSFGNAPENSSTPSFGYNGYTVSYALLPAANLAYQSYASNRIEIRQATKYMLPYYSGFSGYNYTMPKSNTEDYTKLKPIENNEVIYYEVDYYDFCFETQYQSYSDSFSWYSGVAEYTNWVKANYLGTAYSYNNDLVYAFCDYYDCESYYNSYYYYYYNYGYSNYLDYFIDGLEDYFGSHEKLVNAVAKYVRSAATYNIHYNRALDDELYMPKAFLTTYKEGTAKHFAAAGTMLYRALGIPARYVEGYFVESQAYTTVDVKDEHAWVEVYLEGYGWMQMEVTPGFGMDSGKQEITIKPKDASKEYDGKSLVASDFEFVNISDNLKALFDSGYYRVKIEQYHGAQIPIGKSESRIEGIKILDQYGNDVTYEFDVKTEKGTLEVTRIQIEVYLYSISKTYDGTPLSYPDSNFFSIRDQVFKASGYTLDLKVLFENSDIHTLTVADLNELIDYYISYTVMDGAKDITDYYSIKIVPLNPNASEEDYSDYVVYEISKVQLVLEAESITQYYEDGMVLEGPNVKIVGGGLLEGHTLSATTTGTLDKVGMAYNEIELYSLSIVDQDGYDVTYKYDIETRKGILQLIAKPEK